MTELFKDCSQHEQIMYVSAYNTIHSLEAWEFLKNYDVDPKKGFANDTNLKIIEIMNAIQKDYNYGHSGCSMALTMRVMHDIAKNNNYNEIE